MEIFYTFALHNARVAELVDALDSKSSDFGRAGSIPASSTFKTSVKNRGFFILLNDFLIFKFPARPILCYR